MVLNDKQRYDLIERINTVLHIVVFIVKKNSSRINCEFIFTEKNIYKGFTTFIKVILEIASNLFREIPQV